jgi:hypothetical protein
MQTIDQMREETREFKYQLPKSKQWAIGMQMIKHQSKL